MNGSIIRHRLISVCLRPLCLLLTIHLFSRTVHCNSTASDDAAVTHPSTHRAQRNTTSAFSVDKRQHTVSATDVDFTGDRGDVSNVNLSDFHRTNKTPAINESVAAGTVSVADFGLISKATEEYDELSLVGQLVPDHVTSLTYLSPTDDSPVHVTNATNDITATETGSSNINNPLPTVDYDDVIVTSSHGVRSNNATPTTPWLLEELTGKIAEGTTAWESWTTNVEHDVGNDSSRRLITSSMTSLNYTARHHARALINSGMSVY